MSPRLCLIRSLMKPLFGSAGIIAFWACAMAAAAAPTEPGVVAVSSQPANVGDAKIAALAYHDSGAYDRDLTTAASAARQWLTKRTAIARRPALILDIDETALSNWEILKRDDFGRPINGPCTPGLDTPCGWAAWDQLGIDPPIGPTLEVFQHARSLKITVFFITGRPESQRAATNRNLVTAGFGDYEKLYMVPDGKHFASAADFKAPIRAEIEQAGYTIVANVGDQPSDLQGGHAERSFLLPDPYYRVP